MGKKSPKPPEAPDPWESSAASAYWNTFNQQTPFGSLTFSGGGLGPDGRPTGGARTANLNLSPELQQQFDMQNQVTQGTLEQALQRQGQFDASPLTFEGLPGYQSNINFGGIPQAQLQQNLDFQGLPGIPGFDPSGLTPLDTNFDAATQRVSDALFQRGAAQLDPIFSRQQDRLEQRLADQGLPVGGEAYSRDFGDFRRSMGDAYGNLALDATLAGSGEQARLFGQSLAARQQGAGEQGQAFGQALGARQQLGGEAMQQGQFGNQAALAQYGIDSAGRQMSVQDQLLAAELQNQARAQGFNERGAVRGAQFNELASLLGLQQTNPSQVSMGGFFAPGATDFLGAQGQQLQAQNAAYQGQVAQNNAKTGALGSLGGAAMMGAGNAGSFGQLIGGSDRRLKRNIKRIGTTLAGLPLYLFQYLWSDKPEIGVMADEVETVMPEAVVEGPDGYKMVNYAMVH